MDLNNEARKFAVHKHGNQRYGEYPYVFHLDMVVSILMMAGIFNKDIIRAAFLHDVLEDTNCMWDEISIECGSNVKDIVEAVTDNPDSQLSRFENKRDLFQKIFQDHNYSAALVKLADRIANLLMCASTKSKKHIDMYIKEDDLISTYIKPVVTNVVLISMYEAALYDIEEMVNNNEV